MAEIIYAYTGKKLSLIPQNIRWLSKNELGLFNEHLLLCGQEPLPLRKWNEAYECGTMYCLLFENNMPVARACVEKYSCEKWEVADVRVVKAHRNRGLAYAAAIFVLNYILDNSKTATIRTEDRNEAMKKVIKKIGFSIVAKTLFDGDDR